MVPLLLAVATATACPAPPPDLPEPGRCLRAVRVAEPIRVDGRLDEAEWGRTDPAAGFRQREPVEGQAASEPTEVRVLYDDRNLYVGVLARDAEPDRLISRILQRDRVLAADGDGRYRFAGDDAVAILLDPFDDHRNAVVFATNPAGAEFDALVTDESAAMNADWRGLWTVAARRVPEGWSAEFAIPLSTLRHPSGAGHAWGFNVARIIRRKNEETLWSAWSRDQGGFHRVSRAGHLVGIDDLPAAAHSLDLKPLALAGFDRAAAGTATEGRTAVGADAKYELRPGLVLDATVRPDFAQVEDDAQQVNLTRFGLYFPEKREFFLENAGVFDLGLKPGGEPPPFLLFFSRRIGYSDDGAVPVLGGVRLTGRVGQQTVGFLDAVTEPAFGVPRTNYGALRVKRDVGASNHVGLMVTDVRRDGHANTAAGVDASFWPTPSLQVQGFVARTQTSGPGGDGSAYRLKADYQTDRVGLTGWHLTVDPEANAEMGFITRKDVRRTGVGGRYTWRPSFWGLRKAELSGYVEYFSRVDGETQDWRGGPSAYLEWNSGDNVGAFYEHDFTRLDEGFTMQDRVPIPAGDYQMEVVGLWGGTSASRPVVENGYVYRQGFYGGRLWGFGTTTTVAAGSHLSASVGVTHNAVHLPRGAFDADLASLRLSYAFSTRLTASSLVQYNRLDHKLRSNLRLAYTYRPGSDIFIAYNEGRGGAASSLLAQDDRSLVVKMTYLARF